MRLVISRQRDVLVGELGNIGVVVVRVYLSALASSGSAYDHQLAVLVFDFDSERRVGRGLLHERAFDQRRVGSPLAFLDAELVSVRPGDVDHAEVLGLVTGVARPGRSARQHDLLRHVSRCLRRRAVVRVVLYGHREGYRYLDRQRTADVCHQLLHVRLIGRRLRDVLVGELRGVHEVTANGALSRFAGMDRHAFDLKVAHVVLDLDLDLGVGSVLLVERAFGQRRGGGPLAFLEGEGVGVRPGDVDQAEVLDLVLVTRPGRSAGQHDLLSHVVRYLRCRAVVRVLRDRHGEGYRYLDGQRAADVGHQLLYLRLIGRGIRDVFVGELRGVGVALGSSAYRRGLARGGRAYDHQLAVLVFDLDLERCVSRGLLHESALSQRRGGRPLTFSDAELVFVRPGDVDHAEVLDLVLVTRPGRSAWQLDLLSHILRLLRGSAVVRILGDLHREGYLYRSRQRAADVGHQLLHVRLVGGRLRDVLVGELRGVSEFFTLSRGSLTREDLHFLDEQAALLVILDDHLDLRGRGRLLDEGALSQLRLGGVIAFHDIKLISAGVSELDLAEVLGLVGVGRPGRRAGQLYHLSQVFRSQSFGAAIRVLAYRHREGHRDLHRQRPAYVGHQLLHVRLVVYGSRQVLVGEEGSEREVVAYDLAVATVGYLHFLDVQVALAVVVDRYLNGRGLRSLVGEVEQVSGRIIVFRETELILSGPVEANRPELGDRAFVACRGIRGQYDADLVSAFRYRRAVRVAAGSLH